MDKVTLEGSLVAACHAYVRREFQRPKFRLYEKLQQKEHSTMLSLEAAAAYAAMEQAFGIARAVKQTFNGLVQEHPEKELFLTAYGLFCGSQAAVQQLPESSSTFRGSVEFAQGYYGIIDCLLQLYVQCILTEKRIGAATRGYLEWLAADTKTLLQQDRYDGLLQALQPLEVHGITLHGIHPLKQEFTYHGSFDEVIGNREAKQALRHSLECVLSYKPAEKRNILKEEADFPQKVLLAGREGTGKTTLLRALAAYGQQRAAQEGIAFQVVQLSNAFKSEFYSVSARNLRQQLQAVHQGQACYLILAEDIDTIFHARDELKNSPEDKAIIGELLNLLEGIADSGLGNYLLVATTNHVLSQDTALLSRLREHQFIATGPETAADYTLLLQKKLKMSPEEGKDWDALGALCLSLKLSGRAVRNIAVQLLESKVSLPTDWYRLSLEQQQGHVRQQKSTLRPEQIEKRIREYTLFTAQCEEPHGLG